MRHITYCEIILVVCVVSAGLHCTIFSLFQLLALLGSQTNANSSDVNVNWLLDRLGSTMPSAGNSTSATPASIPSNEECGIRDVWAHNLDEEFKTIRQIVQKYHWIAMVNKIRILFRPGPLGTRI